MSAALLSSSAQLGRLARHELALSFRSLLAWSLPTGALLAMTLSMQKSMSERGSAFEQKIAAMPREMLLAFGLDRPNLTEPVGYLAANASLYTIVGALYAALLGATLATREATTRTGEMLFTQPLARSTSVAAKSIVGLGCVAGFNVVMLLSAALAYGGAGVAVARKGAFVSVFAGSSLIHCALFALSLALSVSLAQPRSAASKATALAFGLYGLAVVARASDKLRPLARLSPFSYADAGDVAANGALPLRALALAPLIVVLALVARVRFARRDIDA